MKNMKKIVSILSAVILSGTLSVPFTANAGNTENIPDLPVATSESISDYDWTFTTPRENSSAEIVKDSDGNRMMHIQYVAAGWVPIQLNRKIATPANSIDWSAYTIYFKIKGTYSESAIVIGNDNIDGHLRYLNNTDYVTKKELGDGWTQYAVKTNGKNTNGFRIKIYSNIDAYVDDFKVIKLDENGAEIAGDHLDNGSFDYAPTGEELATYDWTFTPHTSNPSSAEIVEYCENDKMMHIEYTTSAWTPIQLNRKIATPANSIDWNAYTVYFKIKGIYNEGAIVIGNDNIDGHLRYLNNTDYVTKKELGDGWTQYAVKTNGKNSSGFRIKIYSNTYAYVDDFMVVKHDASGNIIAGDHLYNGSFDSLIASAAKTPDGWISVGGANNTGVTYMATADTTHAYSGKYAYYLSGPAAYVSGWSADARTALAENIDYTKSYTLKVKVYTPCPETQLAVLFTTAANAAVSQKTLNSANATIRDLGNGWYEYTTTMQATDGYNQLTFRTSGMVGGVWIDDVSLTDENGVNYIANGSFDEFKTAKFGEFALMDDGYELIDAPVAGENIVSIAVDTLEAGNDYKLVLAIYKNEVLFDVVITESLNTPVGEQEMLAGITLDTVSDGVYTAKAFLWDDGMTPYTKTAQYPASN